MQCSNAPKKSHDYLCSHKFTFNIRSGASDEVAVKRPLGMTVINSACPTSASTSLARSPILICCSLHSLAASRLIIVEARLLCSIQLPAIAVGRVIGLEPLHRSRSANHSVSRWRRRRVVEHRVHAFHRSILFHAGSPTTLLVLPLQRP